MYKISREDAIELRKEMKKTKKNVNAYKRLEAVAYRGEGKTNKEIAELTGYNSDYVGMLAKKYVAGGIKSLLEGKCQIIPTSFRGDMRLALYLIHACV